MAATLATDRGQLAEYGRMKGGEDRPIGDGISQAAQNGRHASERIAGALRRHMAEASSWGANQRRYVL
jgi:hypothetical protein